VIEHALSRDKLVRDFFFHKPQTNSIKSSQILRDHEMTRHASTDVWFLETMTLLWELLIGGTFEEMQSSILI
jgi:hypothetical protein